MKPTVLDTNVLASGISALNRSASAPGSILEAWFANEFPLVASEPILTELTRTLANPYFLRTVSPVKAHLALIAIRGRARIVPITAIVQGVATHPEDDAVLATAVSAGAGFLVTGDRALQALGAYQGVAIVLPRAFLDTLDRAAGR